MKRLGWGSRKKAGSSAALAAADLPRKPRLMIAGEFSAGKTQLITGLIGDAVLPSNVTATALPAVWLIGGAPAMIAVGDDGAARTIGAIGDVGVEDTQFCVLSHGAPFLRTFDVIDTPGNSDPNIPQEKWERMLDYADAVVWCTNATQAWRQSEKAVWNDMPERLLKNSTLIVTHADRITDEKSAERVMRRVQREAGEYFQSFLMASLLKADDINRIRQHFHALSDRIPASGQMNRAVIDFALAHPAPQVARIEETEPALAPATTTATVEPAARAAPGTADPDGNVLVLVKPLPKEPPAPTSAHALWASLAQGVDLTDADAVLACVMRLLVKLDEPQNAAAPPGQPPDDTVDETQRLVDSVMGRRML